MLKIRLFCICKTEKDAFNELMGHYTKLCKSFGGDFEVIDIFSKKVNNAHKRKHESLEVYSDLLAPYVSQGFSVAFDMRGISLDSFRFAEILKDKRSINFFIGGAYGLHKDFLNQCQKVVSLSPLTLSHKVAKVVAGEQIYRALSLLNNHPYHK